MAFMKLAEIAKIETFLLQKADAGKFEIYDVKGMK